MSHKHGRSTKTKQKFQFTMTLHRLDLGTNLSPCLGVQWTRGTRTAISSYVPGQDGVVSWNGEELTLMSTLFRNSSSNSYEKKRSKIAIKQRVPGQTKPGREKRVGVIELYLNEFVGMEVEHELELPVERCKSSQNAVMYISLRCSWVRTMGDDDDNISVSQLSGISSGTNNEIHQITDGNEEETFVSDVGDLASLEVFDEMLQKKEARQIQENVQSDVFNVRINALQEENLQLRDELEGLKKQLAMSGESGFSQEWQELHADLKLTRGELENVQNQIVEERLRNEKEKHLLNREIRSLQTNNDEVFVMKQITEEKQNQIAELNRERQELDDQIINEKANAAELQIELAEIRKKHQVAMKSLTKLREELAKCVKENEKQKTKYRDVMKTLHMSPNQLMRSNGFYRTQLDDLEQTLMMVRKSWKDTSHILETQISAMNSELLDVKMQNSSLKESLLNQTKKNKGLRAEVEELHHHKAKMAELLTKHEVKLAKKMVALVNSNNLLQAAQDNVLQLQTELDDVKDHQGLQVEIGGRMEEIHIDDLISQETLAELETEGNFSPLYHGRTESGERYVTTNQMAETALDDVMDDTFDLTGFFDDGIDPVESFI